MARIDRGSLSYGGVSFQFGEGTPFHILGFDRTGVDWEVGDVSRPRSDGIGFGRDRKRAASYELRLAVDASTPDEARELMSQVQVAWGDAAARIPGADAAFSIVGERVCYGRPRGVELDVSRLSSGRVFMRCLFVAESDRWYGPSVSQEIRFAPAVGGGLRFPARAPFRFTAGPASRNASVLVEGVGRAWPVFEIVGPVSDPEVDLPGVGRLQFRVSLAHDQRLVVDTRPWARWVKRGYVGGELSAFPGALLPSGLRLSDVSLAPGAHQVVLRGFDPSGTALLRVWVESVFPSF